MSQIQNSETGLELGLGLILTIVGIALIAIAALQRAGQALGCVIYIAGFATSGGGITLVWKDLLNSAGFPGEAPSKSPGRYLGAFRLNGYHIQAYERQRTEDNRKEFRLLSTPKMDAELEAACIRYLVNEALIEELWPRMSKKIAEEAKWAFFAQP
jgi:hypothetical protein